MNIHINYDLSIVIYRYHTSRRALSTQSLDPEPCSAILQSSSDYQDWQGTPKSATKVSYFITYQTSFDISIQQIELPGN
jgi:hypothetical protein